MSIAPRARLWWLCVVAVVGGCSSDVPPAPIVDVEIAVSAAESSASLSDTPVARGRESEVGEREPALARVGRGGGVERDPVVQSALLPPVIPGTTLSFAGQAGTSTGPNPPDANGAVGPNYYVQVVSSQIEIWNKAGGVVMAARNTSALWTGYVGTNAGNKCATQNDGDAVVLYDQIADRWVVTQFSLPSGNTIGGPSFQCVAVSKTGDPTGAYWLYDFKYSATVNELPRVSVWPDAYYASFNLYNLSTTTQTYLGPDLCAFDRAAMLHGRPASQICFAQCATYFADLPVNFDGVVPPPRGTPGFFVGLGFDAAGNTNNTLVMWKLHADFAAPASSTITGPTAISVDPFTAICAGVATDNCVPQNTIQLSGASNVPGFRLTYRNFGTYESVLFSHSVKAGTTGGIRWYEIRSPNATPTVAQQGTYAPADTTWRWMPSMAQDEARDIALGFSLASATLQPEIGCTGRLPSDAAGKMGQGEGIIVAGNGFTTATRWGDFDSMWVDPTDNCTFWYTNEYFTTDGASNWSTQNASFKFPSCGAHEFTLAVSPATQSVGQGNAVSYTVSTPTATTDRVVLNVQDLPAGVTGAFNPTSMAPGGASTLTLTATPTAPVVAATTFMVIGTSASAVHSATAQVAVTACTPLTTCPAGDNCGTIPDGCGGAVSCGMCVPPDQCHSAVCTANVCAIAPLTGTTCNDSNMCTTGDVCTAGVCSGTAVVCTAQDQCPVAGSCDPSTGVCSNPTAGEGTSCNDSDPCTTSDTCTAGACGGTAVTCAAQDECHVAGSCGSDGTCSNPPASDGTACSVGSCVGGACVQTPPAAGVHDASGTSNGSSSGGCCDAGGDAPSSSLLIACVAFVVRRRSARPSRLPPA